MVNFLFLLVLFLAAQSVCAEQTIAEIRSPGDVLSVRVTLDGGRIFYQVQERGAKRLLPSRLGLGPSLSDDFHLISTVDSFHSEDWRPTYGEHAVLPDHYRQSNLVVENKHGRLLVQVRSYDEGIAIRYGVEQATTVHHELTEFHFSGGGTSYTELGTEGNYHKLPVSLVFPHCQEPLTIVLPSGIYVAILDAGNVDYSMMYLRSRLFGLPLACVGATCLLIVLALMFRRKLWHNRLAVCLILVSVLTVSLWTVVSTFNTVRVDLGGDATIAAHGYTPWRLILVARSPAELLQHDYLVQDLAPRTQLTDVSWIKPGASMNIIPISDTAAHTVVDFAAAHHIPYVLIDDFWYGPEDAEHGDATHERTVDQQKQPAPALHIAGVAQYARERAIGLFVYVDRRQMKKQRETLLNLYQRWGVAGIKIGFVKVGTQQDTKWLTETVRLAAEHHLLVDIHDAYRPTGYSVTYPNLLTVEGVRGNEHFPTAQHDTTIPFTRFLAGEADFTICYYYKLVNTHAHQMAMSVVAYSPLQHIFWYDQPKFYHGEPEITWFEELPTTWDDTRVLAGDIGHEVVVARRSGERWYVAAANGEQGRTLPITVNFLAPDTLYDATLYTDDPAVPTATHIRIAKRQLQSTDTITLELLPRGGEAILLTPHNSSSSKLTNRQ